VTPSGSTGGTKGGSGGSGGSAGGSPPPLNPQRGEIWKVDLEPVRGREMGKPRPCVVMSLASVGRLPLRLVVPLTGWQDRYTVSSWMVKVEAEPDTGLDKDSAADTFQTRSVDLSRFIEKWGVLSEEQLQAVAEAIALTVGYRPPTPPSPLTPPTSSI
jgi:mRNA interferase MazF